MNTLPLLGAICRLILVGDSTLQVGTGYGPALCSEVVGQCINSAVGGTSSSSFRERGYWIKPHSQITRGTVVIIEFGHNDRWSRSHRKTTEFESALTHYVAEVRARGGIPVIGTPIAERRFINGTLSDDLSPWAARAAQVAQRTSTPLLSLHAATAREVKRLGPVGSMTLAQIRPNAEQLAAAKSGTSPKIMEMDAPRPKFDYTHLGRVGAASTAQIAKLELAQLGWARCLRTR